MPTHVIAVLCTVPEDQDKAFNEWYENEHAPGVLRIPGFQRITRLVLNEEQSPSNDGTSQKQYRYMTLVELETDDLAATFAASAASPDTAGIQRFVAPGDLWASVYRPLATYVAS